MNEEMIHVGDEVEIRMSDTMTEACWVGVRFRVLEVPADTARGMYRGPITQYPPNEYEFRRRVGLSIGQLVHFYRRDFRRVGRGRFGAWYKEHS